MRSRHPRRLPTARLGIGILNAIAQQHRTTIHCLAAFQRHGRDWGALVAPGGVKHAGRAVHGGADDQVELIDQSSTQKRAIGSASSFEQQALHAELAIEDVQRAFEVELRLAGEDLRHAFAA